MASPEEHKRIVRRLNAMWEGDLDLVDRVFAGDFVNHDPMQPGLPPGPEGVKRTVAAIRKGFPGISFDIEPLRAEDDEVAFRTVGRGRHEGPFMETEPTGREVEMEGIVILRFEDGKVVERWAKFNTMAMMRQIGALAETEPPSR